MTRKLKVLLLAAMAVTAFGAFNVAGAHAAEEFHCESAPCKFTLKTDGTGTTAHHVFVVKNAIGESISFTCESLTGSGSSAAVSKPELTVTNIAYDKCKSVLGEAKVDMNECDYHFTAEKGGEDKATVTIKCPEGKKIEVTASAACTVKVGAQGPLEGIGYHNLGVKPAREVTVTAKVPGIKSEIVGECGIDATKTPITSEYTTGNTIATAETEAGGMIDGWWE